MKVHENIPEYLIMIVRDQLLIWNSGPLLKIKGTEQENMSRLQDDGLQLHCGS